MLACIARQLYGYSLFNHEHLVVFAFRHGPHLNVFPLAYSHLSPVLAHLLQVPFLTPSHTTKTRLKSFLSRLDWFLAIVAQGAW